MNVSLFGHKVFAEVKKRSSWVRMGPNAMTSECPGKKRKGDTETERCIGRRSHDLKAEIGVMRPQTHGRL